MKIYAIQFHSYLGVEYDGIVSFYIKKGTAEREKKELEKRYTTEGLFDTVEIEVEES